jgi:hypothetical protein
MKELGELLHGIGVLLWPILGFIALCWFREEIRRLLRRLKRGKLLGQEFELEASVTELTAVATTVAAEHAAIPASAPPDDHDKVIDSSKAIFAEASRSPRAAFLYFVTEIEREARNLISKAGIYQNPIFVTLDHSLRVISEHGLLPANFMDLLQLFVQTRNKLVHESDDADDGLFMRSIESASIVLNVLRTIPEIVHRVYQPGVDLYSDPEGKVKLAGLQGIIIESSFPRNKLKRILPTRGDYRKGSRVTWKLNTLRTDAAWYRDPDSNELKKAWDSNFEFIGQPIVEN